MEGMEKKKEVKREVLMILLYFFILAGFILIKSAVWGGDEENDISFLEKNWAWVKPDGSEVPVSGRRKVPVKAGEPLIIKGKVPEDMDRGMDLCFRSTLESVRVWLDGRLVYTYGIQEEPDRVWNNIYISASHAGQEIMIEKICPYGVYKGQIHSFLWGNYQDVQEYLVSRYMPDYVIGLILLIIGVLIIPAAVILKSRGYAGKMGIYLGIFTILLAAWICGESRIPTQYWLSGSMETSCVILMLAPIVYLLYLEERTEKRYQKGHRLVLAIAGISAVVNISMHLLGIADVVETLPVTHLVIFLVTGFTIYEWCREWTRQRKSGGNIPLRVLKLMGTVGMLLAVVAECIIFYLDEYSSTGSHIQAAMLVYIAILLVGYFNTSLEQMKNAEAATLALKENQLRMMVSQIQPHFLYNTLIAIQELCYTDPEKAADTIVTFADYLRGNMNFLEEESLIRFNRELRHVQNYMEIQKVRFGDELNFVQEIRCIDFMIPPLSVQPIVENAVQHGVRGRAGSGTVKLTVYRQERSVLIIIEDDGAGFDTEADREEKGFSAIGNVERRIKVLLDGELYIESKVGKGTRVTIRIPDREEEKSESSLG